MTKVIFDVNCLGYSVGDDADLADTQAERLIRAGAAHEPGSGSVAYGDIVKEARAHKEKMSKVTKPAEPMVTKGD